MIPNISPMCIRITTRSLNIAVDKHIECGMKLTDGSLAKFEPLLRATWHNRAVTWWEATTGSRQFVMWAISNSKKCCDPWKLLLYVIIVIHIVCIFWNEKVVTSLKKKTFLWLHLGLHHGSIIRIIQVGSYSISSSSAWKSQKKRSETSRSTDYLSKKLWLYPIRPYVVCCCML